MSLDHALKLSCYRHSRGIGAAGGAPVGYIHSTVDNLYRAHRLSKPIATSHLSADRASRMPINRKLWPSFRQKTQAQLQALRATNSGTRPHGSPRLVSKAKRPHVRQLPRQSPSSRLPLLEKLFVLRRASQRHVGTQTCSLIPRYHPRHPPVNYCAARASQRNACVPSAAKL